MAQRKGRTLLIQVGDGATPEVFTSICGVKTRSFGISTEAVDTTIPDCEDPGGPVVRTQEPGIQDYTFSGSGAFLPGVNTKLLLDHVRASTTFNAKVIVPGDGTYTAEWFVTEFEFTGEMSGNMEFSATFNPSSPPAFVAEA